MILPLFSPLSLLSIKLVLQAQNQSDSSPRSFTAVAFTARMKSLDKSGEKGSAGRSLNVHIPRNATERWIAAEGMRREE